MNLNLKNISLGSDLKDQRIRTLLQLLILTDLLFIILHIFHAFRIFYFTQLSLEEDLGFPEVFQYIKEFWLVLLFVFIAWKRREYGFWAWALLFLFFMLDDALQIHEFLNDPIAETLSLPSVFGLRPKDLAELLYAAVMGIFFIVLLLGFYTFGTEFFRKLSRNLLVLVLVLAFFGVFIDMLHIILDIGHRLKQLLGLIEDGGEMIVMSLTVGYIYLVSRES